jgi:hypothetical protein
MTDAPVGNDELADVECPGCGLPQRLWPEARGFVSQEGELYCCEDCAAGEICACDPERKAIAMGA